VSGGEQQVGLAGAGGADQAQVLGCADPFESGEVVHRRLRDAGRGDFEAVEGLGDGEAGGAVTAAAVGVVACGDLGFDEGAQHLFGLPPLGLGGLQDLGCGASHCRELEAAQSGLEVGGERGWCGGHDDTSRPSSRSGA
jgi:hypothetical protein